jgi:pimeloyl-ACP methyl ester carboxylesterase
MWERPYDPKWERRAHHVVAPTRVVWGAADRFLPPEHGARLATLLGAPPPTVVPDAGHLVGVDAPADVAAVAAALAGSLRTGAAGTPRRSQPEEAQPVGGQPEEPRPGGTHQREAR